MDCYEKGQRFYSRNFVLFVHKRGELSQLWRLGLAVGRKIGSAVERNRVKRVLREFFRLHQHELPVGVDYVVVPKKHLDVSKVNLEMVSGELSSLLQSHDLRKAALQTAALT